MTKKLTRRGLAAVATGAVIVTRAAAQQPSASEQAKAAREANLRAAETLSRFEIPIGTEPAFQFKA